VRGIQTDKNFALLGAAMDVIREFAQSLTGRKPSTIRLYVAGAKAAIKAAGANVSKCGSYAQLLSILRKRQPIKAVRVAPFLRFLEQRAGGGTSRESLPLARPCLRPARGIGNSVALRVEQRGSTASLGILERQDHRAARHRRWNKT
jgi:hypothetical protein